MNAFRYPELWLATGHSILRGIAPLPRRISGRAGEVGHGFRPDADRLQETLRKYNNRGIETAQGIEELIAMAKQFQEEMERVPPSA